MDQELYPGQAEDLRKRAEMEAQIDRAHAAVLPGALREAFGGEPGKLKLGLQQFELQSVTLALTANLERIKSPLLEVVRIMREVFSQSRVRSPRSSTEDSGLETGDCKLKGGDSSLDERMAEVKERIGKEIQFQEEQIAETCLVFVSPQKRIRQLLDAGRDTFREAAMEELGDRLHPAQMAALQRACAQHYVASFATIIGYGSPPPEEGAVVFRQPSPGAVTGSAGG
jgi:hypothetical protein